MVFNAAAQVLAFCTIKYRSHYWSEARKSEFSRQNLCHWKWGRAIWHDSNIKATEIALYRTDGTHLSHIGNKVFLNNLQGGLETFLNSAKSVFPWVKIFVVMGVQISLVGSWFGHPCGGPGRLVVIWVLFTRPLLWAWQVLKFAGFENVGTCGCNCGVYSWVTLGPPPPHPQEGRPTPANRWGTLNWNIGNTSFSLSFPMVGCGA